MCCKLKSMLMLAGLIGAGVVGVNAVRPGLVGTAWRSTVEWGEKQIPPELELKRIRDQIAKLTPDMHRHIEKIAEETVAVDGLERKIALVRANLAERKAEILAIADKVETGDVRRTGLSGKSLKDKLERDLKSYKSAERDLLSKEKLLTAKRQALEAAKLQLTEIQSQKTQLEEVAAQFEAELETLKLEQTRSKFQIDDTRLGQIKASIEKLRQKIDVERKKIELTGEFQTGTLGEKPIENADRDVVDEVRAYFGEKAKAVKGAAEVDPADAD